MKERPERMSLDAKGAIEPYTFKGCLGAVALNLGHIAAAIYDLASAIRETGKKD